VEGSAQQTQNAFVMPAPVIQPVKYLLYCGVPPVLARNTQEYEQSIKASFIRSLDEPTLTQ
jgi:hypothetical protein